MKEQEIWKPIPGFEGYEASNREMFKNFQALISFITRKPRQMRRESKPATVSQPQPVRVILVGRPW